jgi:hypothetical protein
MSYLKWSKIKRCFIAISLKLCFRICHYEGPRKPGGTEIKWDTSAAVDMNLLGDNIDTIKKNIETLTPVRWLVYQ